jgi:hypothetical protein
MSNENEHYERLILAYQSWQNRGQPMGSPEIDWAIAEQVMAERRLQVAASETGSSSIPENERSMGSEEGIADEESLEAEQIPQVKPPVGKGRRRSTTNVGGYAR